MPAKRKQPAKNQNPRKRGCRPTRSTPSRNSVRTGPISSSEADSSNSDREEDSEEDGDSEWCGSDDELDHDAFVQLLGDVIVSTLINDKNNDPSQSTRRVQPPRAAKNRASPPDQASALELDTQPQNFDQLIALARRPATELQQTVDCFLLKDLLPALQKLEAMIGLEDVKNEIARIVIQRMQRDLLAPRLGHIIMYGDPGTGKTTLANILAEIVAVLYGKDPPVVVKGSSSTMIASFVGQTGPKTEELVKSAFGGVLLIDEASSLSDGRSEGNSDSFSKSAIDNLNRMLTEEGDKFTCILAGYRHQIHRDFLDVNPGLKRRFSFVFELNAQTPDKLALILKTKLSSVGKLNLDDVRIDGDMFKEGVFSGCGGDIEVLADKIILAHSVNVLGKKQKSKLSQKSVEEGFRIFKLLHQNMTKSKGSVDMDQIRRDVHNSMYT